MKKFLILPLIIALAGCANFQNVQTVIGPPDQVQAEVTALGAIGKIYVPASDVPRIHTFATALANATTLNSSTLISLIPHTGHPKTDAIITASAAFVNLALAKYGTSDPQVIAYAHAVGNGLLVSFP